MSSAAVLLLVEQLVDNIEDLEEDLQPVISTALSATTKKLPLLDKAKLYVVIVYAIESLLFSYLRLNGVTAKEHPAFRELTRVKQYFEKIKEAEQGPPKPRENLSLNKQAAGRFIKHALSGNEKYDLERAEREAREKFLAKRRLADLEKTIKEKVEAKTSSPTSSQLQPNTVEEDVVMREAAHLAAQIDDDREEGEVEDDDSVEDAAVMAQSHDTTAVNSTSVTQSPHQTAQAQSKRKRGKEHDSLGTTATSTGTNQDQEQHDEARLTKKARRKAKKVAKKDKK